MTWRQWLSREVLTHRSLMAILMICYIPGTIYGYYWYENQLRETWNSNPLWQLPFVPDSPTASLFFALALLWLWLRPEPSVHPFVRGVRGVLEALAVVTSLKYGIWACAIIFLGAAQGDTIEPSSWMLVFSHGAMAICAVLYGRFFHYGGIAIAVAAAWTFLNDSVDYGFDVYPYLPYELKNDVTGIAWFTFLLTAFSVFVATWAKFGPTWERGLRIAEDKRF
ncbi:DUF1405 domain-containing protein [Cohnella fermenti]|uniref:DUF1405 domain-containing protein n=1 Tax=Cohnella fermenti TaxID=2565925 RepID=A0A4S4BTH5_9BACL|nr:DUF1405 domain-containing protein [Cohnella fermenti]THF78394.1 DUF1405 domain-containing protein [Cohnella fermenti]